MKIPPLFQSWLPSPASPPHESGWARMLRWIEDRQNLAELDDRLLRDIGLTRADVIRGAPFGAGDPDRPAIPLPHAHSIGEGWA